MSFNRIIIQGNIGSSELKTTGSGMSVLNVSVAENYTTKDASGEKQEMTNWFRVAFFGTRAEGLAKYLTTGRNVTIEGRVKQQVVTNPDGTKTTYWNITGDEVHFGPKSSKDRTDTDSGPRTDNELPF